VANTQNSTTIGEKKKEGLAGNGIPVKKIKSLYDGFDSPWKRKLTKRGEINNPQGEKIF